MSQAVYFLLLPNVLSLDVSGPAETLRLAGQFSLRYLSPAPQIVCSIGMTLSGLQPLPERLEDGERQIIYLRKYEIGYVSQFLNVMPRTTARELIEQAVLEMGHDLEYAKSEAQKMLLHFEIDNELWDTYPNNFSGGEKLRLNIARAMVKRPRLLLLDEPTASLDNSSKIKVRELIEQLKSEGTTMIGIFHDIEFMEGLCDKTYNMQAGTFV